MVKKRGRQDEHYSWLMENIKVLLIFLIVFQNMIEFQLVKESTAGRYIWYMFTMFSMPAFLFVSGYVSKKPQSVLKNIKNLFIPYVLGCILTWAAHILVGNATDFEILRPSQSIAWYFMAVLVYRIIMEAMGEVRFLLPLSILAALWAGTRQEFGPYLFSSQMVVFFPFFSAGYLWDKRYTAIIRKFKGKWILLLLSVMVLAVIPGYMMRNNIAVDIFKGNHSYLSCGLTDEMGLLFRVFMYLGAFAVIVTLVALMPERKFRCTYIGRNTMSIYFFHYPIVILLDGFGILQIPLISNTTVLIGLSLMFVALLGKPVVKAVYISMIRIISFLLFKQDRVKREKAAQNAAIAKREQQRQKAEELKKRQAAIDALAATLEQEK